MRRDQCEIGDKVVHEKSHREATVHQYCDNDDRVVVKFRDRANVWRYRTWYLANINPSGKSV